MNNLRPPWLIQRQNALLKYHISEGNFSPQERRMWEFVKRFSEEKFHLGRNINLVGRGVSTMSSSWECLSSAIIAQSYQNLEGGERDTVRRDRVQITSWSGDGPQYNPVVDTYFRATLKMSLQGLLWVKVSDAVSYARSLLKKLWKYFQKVAGFQH